MNLVLRVLATAQALEKAGQRLFKPHGITVAQFNVLNVLSGAVSGMRASDLAKALIVDPSNVTGLLRRMKTDGYLKEVDNQSDRRQHIVELSPKGRRVWQSAAKDYRQALDAFEGGLSTADLESAEAAIEKILAASSSIP